MELRSLFRLVGLVALPGAAFVFSAPVRADDVPKSYTIALRPRWKAGDSVTMKHTEHKVSAFLKVVDGKETPDESLPPKEDRTTTFEAVVKCLEADADGISTKSLVHFVKYSAVTGDVNDTTIEGAIYRIEGKGDARSLTLVTTGSKPSTAADAWLDESFGKGSKTDAVLALFTPKAAQPVGGTWEVAGADLVAAIGDEVPLDAGATKAELKLESVKGEQIEIHVAMILALKGLPAGPDVTIPWKDGGKGTTTIKHVRPLAASSLESMTETEDSFDGVADTGEFEIHMAVKQAQTTTVKPGGTIPEAK